MNTDIFVMCCVGKCASIPSWRDNSLTIVLYC